jgi:hypothetical protein
MKSELVQQLHWEAKKFSCGQQQLRSKLYNNNNRSCPGKLNYNNNNNNNNRCVQPAIDQEQGRKGDANWCGA